MMAHKTSWSNISRSPLWKKNDKREDSRAGDVRSAQDNAKVVQVLEKGFKKWPRGHDEDSFNRSFDIVGVAVWAVRCNFPLNEALLSETLQRLKDEQRPERLNRWFEPEKRKNEFKKEIEMVTKALPSKKEIKKGPVKAIAKKGGCVRQTTTRYTKRSSPPYPANQCHDKRLPGQGKERLSMYRSKPDKNGVYRWVREK